MPVSRAFLFVPLLVVLAVTGGCKTRVGDGYAGSNVASSERDAEILRLSAALREQEESINRLNAALESERKAHAGDAADKQSLSGQLGDLLKGGETGGAYVTARGSIGLSEDFAFAKGSSELNDAGRKTVESLAAKLLKGDYANAKVIVEGHTDDTPVARKLNVEKYVDNWGLSAARASTVVRALQKAGIPATRLFGAFRGEYDPSGKGKAGDRRVELYVR